MIKVDSIYLNNALADYKVLLAKESRQDSRTKEKELEEFKKQFPGELFLYNIYATEPGEELALSLLDIAPDGAELLQEEAEKKGVDIKTMIGYIVRQHIKEAAGER